MEALKLLERQPNMTSQQIELALGRAVHAAIDRAFRHDGLLMRTEAKPFRYWLSAKARKAIAGLDDDSR